MDNIVKYILLFFFYSAGGWLLESIYCSIGEKKIINRGFLTGPLCPIYGTAAIVMVVLIYNPFRDNALVVFLLGIVLCDIVEYITSYIMEKLFAARWWDYTYELLNINGRICLKHSLYWGIISVVFVKALHPVVDRLYNNINGEYLNTILIVILVIFALDLANAVRKALDIRKLQLKLSGFINMLNNEILKPVKGTVEEKYAVLREQAEKSTNKAYEIKYQIDDLYAQFESMFSKKPKDRKKQKNSISSRIFYNNPDFEMRTKKQIEKLSNLIDIIKANIYEGEEMQ